MLLLLGFAVVPSPAFAVVPGATAKAEKVELERGAIFSVIPRETQRVVIQPVGQERTEPAVQALADLLLQDGMEVNLAAPVNMRPPASAVVQKLAVHQAQLLFTVEVSTAHVVLFTILDTKGVPRGTAKGKVTDTGQDSPPKPLRLPAEPLATAPRGFIDPAGDRLLIEGVPLSLEGPQLYEALGRADLAEEYRGRRTLGRVLTTVGGVALAMGIVMAPIALVADAYQEPDNFSSAPPFLIVSGAAALLIGLVLPYHPVSSAGRGLMIAEHNAKLTTAR